MAVVSTCPTNPADENELMQRLFACKFDPVRFVRWAFPWGKKGTPLENQKGPRRWQLAELEAIRDHLAEQRQRVAEGKFPAPYKSATASGRGIGKSALTSWIILWHMSCWIGSTTIVAANSESQLKSRTWAEMRKWLSLAINTHWFDASALFLRPHKWLADAVQEQLQISDGYWYAQAQLWTEENPDAFAGTHNPLGMTVIFDEASGIPEGIWDVTRGFFTEPDLSRQWLAFSNPRKNTGTFFECFHARRDEWRHKNISSLDVEGLDHDYLRSIEREFGRDHDVTKVEVYGEFPSQSESQLISRRSVAEATERPRPTDGYDQSFEPLIMGVDPARYGPDESVIAFRRGRDARSIPMIRKRGLDNMELAEVVVDAIVRFRPDAVCIDAGNGTGVIDRVRHMGYRVHEVWAGSKSPEPEFMDRRTWLWVQMRDWIGGAYLPDDADLRADLVAPNVEYTDAGKMRLESKKSMKRRGVSSPDLADALSFTFHVKPASTDTRLAKNGRAGSYQATGTGQPYHVFDRFREISRR